MIKPWQLAVIVVATVPMTIAVQVYGLCDTLITWTLEQTHE